MADIIVSNIVKTFGDKTVLAGVGAFFEEGKRTALMGPSGCGKTTLLRIIAGLDTADIGEVYGIEPGDFGMVFQEARLFPTATALENVAVVRKNKNDGFAAFALGALGFDAEDMKKRPAALSGGMQRTMSPIIIGGARVYLRQAIRPWSFSFWKAPKRHRQSERKGQEWCKER